MNDDVDLPWVITNPSGGILKRFATQQERDEELLTGDWPDDVEPAYINEATDV